MNSRSVHTCTTYTCELQFRVDRFCIGPSSTSGICTCTAPLSFRGGCGSRGCSTANRSRQWPSTFCCRDGRGCLATQFSCRIRNNRVSGRGRPGRRRCAVYKLDFWALDGVGSPNATSAVPPPWRCQTSP